MFECLLCGIKGLTKKNEQGELVLVDSPKKEPIKLHTRIKILRDRIRDILPLKTNTKLKRHIMPNSYGYGEYFDFETILGKRTIYISNSYYGTMFFTYYEELSDDIVKCLFELTVREYECVINLPQYKIGYDQITVEQINLAIKEIEDYVNTLYDEYLFHREYHEKQEKLLGDME